MGLYRLFVPVTLHNQLLCIITDTWRPKKDHVAFLADKSQIEQGHHLLAIQLGLEGKIELIDALDKGKT